MNASQAVSSNPIPPRRPSEERRRGLDPAFRGGGPALRRGFPSIAWLLSLGWLLSIAACQGATPIPPRSPLTLDNATPALPAFVAASPTPGAMPTATGAPTALRAAPEPLSLPPGFGISVYAEVEPPLSGLAVAPNGDVFASVPSQNRILVLPDRDANGLMDPEALAIYAEGGILHRPYGLDFAEGWLFVACADGVLRFPYTEGDLQPSGPAERILELDPPAGYPERSLAVGPDGLLYVGVSGGCNHCEVTEDPRRAAVLQMRLDGGEAKLYSAGLRQVLGLAFHPETGDVWAGDRGREGLGEGEPPDEINRLGPGAHFGWPYCFGDARRDPGISGESRFCDGTLAPMVELEAQSGVAGILFYTGTQFPETYRGDLYVALSGSDARRSLPTGYSIVRIPFNGWAPRGEVFDFVSGWLRPDTRRWGSPVDLVQAQDGSLLVSDPGGSRVYRIYHAGADEP